MNYSHSACKYRQGLSKREINGAAGGYLGWRRGSAAGGGGAIDSKETRSEEIQVILMERFSEVMKTFLFCFW